jgi:hypothetical protein
MIYKYRCPNQECKLELEIEEKMSEHGKICHICIECGSILEPVVTGGNGFHLQGQCWAKHGYKSHGVINPDKK